MENKMLTLEKFEEASEVVKQVTQETKLVYSDFYSAQTGNKVYLKPENMQFTGAYKLRGAYYKLSTLTKGTDHSLRRKPCTGCCLCGKVLWSKGGYRYAYDNASYQSQQNQELWC